jgi:hypothetical protein
MKPGLDLSSGETKEIWESTLRTIAKQPGVKAVYWGRQIESPDTVQILVGVYLPTAYPTDRWCYLVIRPLTECRMGIYRRP